MTLSAESIRFLVPGVLLVHGLGHGGALGALLWIRFNPGTPTGAWLTARSWILPGFEASAATTVATTFWVTSLAGFLMAALAFLGIVMPRSRGGRSRSHRRSSPSRGSSSSSGRGPSSTRPPRSP